MRSIPVSKYIRVMGYLVKNWSAGESIYPVYCSFKLTRRCNFRCSFCNCWHKSRTWKDIPTEDVKRIIDNIASSSILLCSFEGGEPLVRDDIEELLRYQSTKPFYLLFTTSERGLLTDYPMDRYAKYIDFLHISIDEGHENMDMYDLLEDYTKLGPIVTIQIVVTKDTIDALESKIRRCYETGVKAVVMVAARLQNAQDHYPDVAAFARTSLLLKKKYPGVIITPDRYFRRTLAPHGCDTSSIVVDADGHLFYACRVMEHKTIDLARESLVGFLESQAARALRDEMKRCTRNCGWYQYYATKSFMSVRESIGALRPYFLDIFRGRQKCAGKMSY